MDPFDFDEQEPGGGTQASMLSTDIAKLITQTIEAQMGSLKETVVSLVKTALGESLDPIQKALTENGDILKSLKGQLGAHAVELDALTKRGDSIQANVRKNEETKDTCSAEMITIQRKLCELEDRSRSNNVRLVGLPLDAEGDDPRGYLQKMLPKWIPTLRSSRNAVVTVDKAHRIFSKKVGPKTMIFRLLHFSDRQAILDGARKVKPTFSDGTKLMFFADYSPGTMAERLAFKDVRTRLWEKGIEAYLLYPAILKINYKGKKTSYSSAKEAARFLDSLGDEEEPLQERSPARSEEDGGEE